MKVIQLTINMGITDGARAFALVDTDWLYNADIITKGGKFIYANNCISFKLEFLK